MSCGRGGSIDSLVEGLARYAERAQVMDVAKDLFAHAAKEYGPVLVFKRLWEELGLGEFLARYVAERGSSSMWCLPSSPWC